MLVSHRYLVDINLTILDLTLKSLSRRVSYLALNYASKRYKIVWDMGGRYHTVGGYDIKIISFDFYGII